MSIPKHQSRSNASYGHLDIALPKKCKIVEISKLPEGSEERKKWEAIRHWYDEECQFKSDPQCDGGRNGLVLLGDEESDMFGFCQSLVEGSDVDIVHLKGNRRFTKKLFKYQNHAKITVIDDHQYDEKKFNYGWLKHICGGGMTYPSSTTRYIGGLPAIVLCYNSDKSKDLFDYMKENNVFEDYCYYVDVRGIKMT